MEISYTYLHSKEVVNVSDGRKLGKVSDVTFCYPENKVTGIVAPGEWCLFKSNKQFVGIDQILKIGDDVILVDIGFCRKYKNHDRCGCEEKQAEPPKRGYEEYE